MTDVIDNGLWKAADYLRENGWVKGHLSQAGQHCAIGGYAAAYGKNFGSNTSAATDWANKNHPDEVKALASAIRELFPQRASGSDAGTVVTFNDHNSTTEEDVIKVFRVAGVKLAVGI